MKLSELITERKKSVKLPGVGSTGVTKKKELDLETEVEDALRKKFGLKRGIDFVFRKNSVQFTTASDVSSKVIGALKGFVAEEVIREATLPEVEQIVGFLNKEFLPSFSRERHDVFGDNDLLDKGNDMKKDAKIFLKDIRQSQFKRDLKGMEKFVKFNPWPKWTSDVIETSDLFDHVDGLAAKKKEFQEFKKDSQRFIEEVKKLLSAEG